MAGSYSEIKTLPDAQVHVDLLMSMPLGQAHPEVMLDSIQRDALAKWAAYDGNLSDHGIDMTVGASLVVLEINRRTGVQL